MMAEKINKIFLIGADGQLGSDLKKVLEREYEILCPLIDELDITHFDKTREYVERNKPDFIINTAVYLGNVDEMEKDFNGTFLVNAFAVKNLAEICRDLNIPLLHLSSDYVFGGEKSTPYTENDLPDPINVYGASKLASEHFIKYSWPKHFIIRPAILFGAALCKHQGRTNLIEKVIKWGKEERHLKFKNDTFISPTYTKELAAVIAELIKTDHYGIYHITNKSSCTPYEFAKEILELTNLEAKLEPVTTQDFEASSEGAKRPLNSVLGHKNLEKIDLDKMSTWREAVAKYLKEKGHMEGYNKIINLNPTSLMTKRQKTKIEGLEIVPLKVNFDDRGYLFEIIHNYDMPKFGQVYIVGDPTKGIIRAFHKHEVLWDYFCIVHGSAKFAFMDDKKESPTYQEREEIVLSEKSPQMIIVPPGVYHGWMSLEDDTIMVSTGSELYNGEQPDEVRIPSDSFGDVWTVKGR